MADEAATTASWRRRRRGYDQLLNEVTTGAPHFGVMVERLNVAARDGAHPSDVAAVMQVLVVEHGPRRPSDPSADPRGNAPVAPMTPSLRRAVVRLVLIVVLPQIGIALIIAALR